MLKLIKYELRKQLFSKIILLVLLGLLEIGFFVGLLTEQENVLAVSIGLYFLLAIGTIFFVAFESVFTFSNDLKTKHSYMLFLTPNSTYKIIGAKVLTTTVTIGLTATAFMGVILLDIAAVFAKFNELEILMKKLQELIALIFHANISYAFVISIILYLVFDLISILVIGMASITLSATFLSNSKGKGIVSVAFFFGISYLMSKLEGLVLPAKSLTSTEPYYLSCIWSLGVVLVFYFFTSYMLDKKVSV